MATTNNLEKIDFLVFHGKRDPNLCAVVYQLISKAHKEEQATLLERFIRGIRNSKSDNSLQIPRVFTEEDRTAYMRKYFPIVDGHLLELFNSGLSERAFYKSLVNYILTSRNLLDDGARAIAIYDCIMDKRLPYAQINIDKALKMTDDEFKDCYDALGNKLLNRVRYIIYAPLDQKTETASLLLNELDNITDERTKAVLLSIIITIIKSDAYTSGFYQSLREDDDFTV